MVPSATPPSPPSPVYTYGREQIYKEGSAQDYEMHPIATSTPNTTKAHSSVCAQDPSAGQEAQQYQADATYIENTATDGAHKNGCRRLWQGIALPVFITILPFLVIVGTLLFLVFNYQVEPLSQDLQLLDDNYDVNAYLVNFNASKLLALASWASSLATMLPAYIMALCSFYTASIVNQLAERERSGHLPTPYQLGLLLEVLAAKPTSIWTVLGYLAWKRRSKLPGFLRFAIVLFLTAVALSYCVLAADTWFHVSLSTRSILQSVQAVPSQNYGDKIPATCNGLFDANSLDIPSCGEPLDDVEPHQIMSDLSDRRQVLVKDNGILIGDNGTSFSFLAPAKPLPGLHFMFPSFAASSSCQPLNRECFLESSSPKSSDGTNIEVGGFRCSDNFYGNFTVNSTDLQAQYSTSCLDNGSGCSAFFADRSLNETVGPGVQHQHRGPDALTGRYANPFFAGIVGNKEDKAGTLSDSSDLTAPSVGGEWFILACQITIYEHTYLWDNYSFEPVKLALASDEVAAVVRKALTLPIESAISQFALNVQNASTSSYTVDQIAAKYAPLLGKTLLAYSSPSWVPAPEQVFRATSVTLVPGAPFFTLIGSCLLFVALGIALTTLALRTEPVPTLNVQARLNVFAVIASRFESVERTAGHLGSLEDMFEEHDGELGTRKVGIVKTAQGGWSYASSGEVESFS